MISFKEAQRCMVMHARKTPVVTRAIDSVVGLFTVDDVLALTDSPRFNNSAVDGYAFAFEERQRTYKLVGELAAGSVFDRRLIRGECVRIFTGAKLPDGADTCVMQEYVENQGATISHSDSGLSKGKNVRLQGEELRAGTHLLNKGTRLESRNIGLLASCGITELKVHKRPEVSILVTGSEFVSGEEVEGRIFNSNGPMLKAAFAQYGIEAEIRQVNDNPDQLKTAIAEAMDRSDLVVSTGGVSVGDYDYVVPICGQLGFEKVFHKVAQKPGKPMYFGVKGEKHFVGLPGNPRAVMIGFIMHILPLMSAMQGASEAHRAPAEYTLNHDLELRGSRTEIIAVQLEGAGVRVSRGQNSHMLASLSSAHGLMIVPAEQRKLLKGERVEVVLL